LLSKQKWGGLNTKEQNTNLGTAEIKELLRKANIDFESVVNKALNYYLPKIFLVCPFDNGLCLQKKQCIECKSYTKTTERAAKAQI
jgi:hypothetical protein